MSLWYDRAATTLCRNNDVSTFSGNQKAHFKRAVKKVEPRPGKALEEQFGVTACSLVNRVRQSEKWMLEFTTLRFTAEVGWSRTPAGIEYRKREIKAEYPDADLTRELFWGLVPSEQGRKEVWLDRRRFRVRESYRDKSDQVLVWDGQTFVAYTKHYTHSQEEYFVDPKLGDRGKIVLADLAWPRSQYHQFWWDGEVQERPGQEDWFGRAEDFILTGCQECRGTRCYVLECRPRGQFRVHRWYVGLEDGLLRGSLAFDEGHLASERWMDRYREVKPGWWFPTVQGFHRLVDGAKLGAAKRDGPGRDQGTTPFVAERYDASIGLIAVDEPFAEDQFLLEFKEGVKVHDLRFGAWSLTGIEGT
jgi:hypothetical protein